MFRIKTSATSRSYWRNLLLRSVSRAGVFLLALLLAACTPTQSRHNATFFVFGTTVTLQFDAPAATAETIEAAVAQHLQQRHREWHAWEPGALGVLNQAIARGEVAATTPSIAALIRSGQQLAHQSEGLFDPGVGKLIALWGFHSSDWPIRTPPPDAEQLLQYRQQRPSISHLKLTKNTVRTASRDVQLDFGGLAKGAAANEVMALLSEFGVQHALLELGGDVAAINRAHQPPWRVGVRDPNAADTLGGVLLSDRESLFTSGTYARFSVADGERSAHILDPRSGTPAHGLRAATVLTQDALLADATATALIVAGRDWQRTARAMGVAAVLVIDDANNCTMTAAMAARLVSRSAAGERCRVLAP
jgi:FAD:protein FMN transferase